MPESRDESCPFRVGYALPTRKIEAFMVPSFVNFANERNIEFISIDLSKPLTEQGPFECIIHKLYDDEWSLNLESFAITNPNVTIIDHPTNIKRLYNRISMLEPVSELNIPQLNIPPQILIQDSESLKSLQTTNEITFPIIVKPLFADGTTNAHNMCLVFNHEGLTKTLKLDPPMVLQEFVNHGGVMFKVYVADEYVKCVKRCSLPDVSKETMDKMSLESGGVMSFSQISSGVITSDDSDDKVKMPTLEFLDEVAKGLRESLGLHLINFDMIKDDKSDKYLIVDINFFPGFEKLPSFETVMTDFLLNIKKSHEEKKTNTKELITFDMIKDAKSEELVHADETHV